MRLDLTKLLKKTIYFEEELVEVKKVDLADKLTHERVCEIDRDEEVRRFLMLEDFAYQMTDEQLAHWVNGHADKIVLGVFGTDKCAGGEEAGKLQGELFVEADEMARVERLNENNLVKWRYEEVNFVEVGYAKYPGARQHQMASALRSLVKRIREEYRGKRILLTGYVEKDNPRSIGVLESAGFVSLGEVVYDKNESGVKDEVFGLDLSSVVD